VLAGYGSKAQLPFRNASIVYVPLKAMTLMELKKGGYVIVALGAGLGLQPK
jgi:hypothetical protein